MNTTPPKMNSSHARRLAFDSGWATSSRSSQRTTTTGGRANWRTRKMGRQDSSHHQSCRSGEREKHTLRQMRIQQKHQSFSSILESNFKFMSGVQTPYSKKTDLILSALLLVINGFYRNVVGSIEAALSSKNIATPSSDKLAAKKSETTFYLPKATAS